MKHINLLPPELKAKLPKHASPAKKVGMGFMITAIVLLLMVVGIIKFAEHSYWQKLNKAVQEPSHKEVLDKPEHSYKTLSPDFNPPEIESSLQDKIEAAKPEPASEGEPGHHPQPEGYTLRMGVFESGEQARQLEEDLINLDLQPSQEESSFSRNTFTVCVGHFPSSEEAQLVVEEMKNHKIEAKAKTLSLTEYTVEVNENRSLPEAQAAVAKLQQLGYSGWIKEETDIVNLYLVKIGPYSTYRDAKEKELEMVQQGYKVMSIDIKK